MFSCQVIQRSNALSAVTLDYNSNMSLGTPTISFKDITITEALVEDALTSNFRNYIRDNYRIIREFLN